MINYNTIAKYDYYHHLSSLAGIFSALLGRQPVRFASNSPNLTTKQFQFQSALPAHLPSGAGAVADASFDCLFVCLFVYISLDSQGTTTSIRWTIGKYWPTNWQPEKLLPRKLSFSLKTNNDHQSLALAGR